MKANELMIGDWVQFPYGIRKVTELYSFLDRVCSEDFSVEEVDAIPLTPEILEKNGFEKVFDEDSTECYRYYNGATDGYIKISLYNGGDGDWSIEIINYEKFNDNKIVYSNNFIFLKVHQLQHALRLCGIDKDLVL